MFDFSTSHRSPTPSPAFSWPPDNPADQPSCRDGDRLPAAWFALCIGNTRSHWAYIEHQQIRTTWDATHLDAAQLEGDIVRDLYAQMSPLRTPNTPAPDAPPPGQQPLIIIASVVPLQTKLWQTWLDRHAHPYRILTLDDIPLAGLYSTLGIDRALAGLGVGQRLGFPCLTIDGGTALTFTGFSRVLTRRGDQDAEARTTTQTMTQTTTESERPAQTQAQTTRTIPEAMPGRARPNTLTELTPDVPPQGILIGGAILPGMGLQYRSLGRQTAQLSDLHFTATPEVTLPHCPIERWARNTSDAVNSGIHRAIGAIAWDFIVDWRRRYPGAIVAITGGDASTIEAAIMQHLHERDGRSLSQHERSRTLVLPDAILWGMVATIRAILNPSFSG